MEVLPHALNAQADAQAKEKLLAVTSPESLSGNIPSAAKLRGPGCTQSSARCDPSPSHEDGQKQLQLPEAPLGNKGSP